MTQQQDEALSYFRSHAQDWRRKADTDEAAALNIIERRNQYVLFVAEERSKTERVLDVGCGTGELVCDLAARGHQAIGLDFAAEMIDLATRKACEAGLANAAFECKSIFDADLERESYDLVSANGFIEYISLSQLTDFIEVVADTLAPGGSFVLGSRNRLFNLTAMNDFTLHELDSGDIAPLVREGVAWTSGQDISSLLDMECATLQASDTRHTKTGIDVATRLQYTPLQLINLLRSRGLHTEEVYPVHVHGVTPGFQKDHADLHGTIANLLQEYVRRDTRLIAHASTFMIHAVKRGA